MNKKAVKERPRVAHQLYHTLLQDSFAERRRRNPSYSLRAFSRDLGISPAALCQVLSYQRALSSKNLTRLAEKLSLSPEQQQGLCRRGRLKGSVACERRLLENDIFHLMSDWYYFGVLSLARTDHCKNDPDWIADRFAISVVEARAALERLERLGLVRQNGTKLERTKESLTTTVDLPSVAGKKLQKQHLTLAQEALDEVSIEKREISSVTMAIDPRKIKLAKVMIAEFKDELCTFLEAGKQESVYVLGLQLFPIESNGKGRA